MKSKIILVVTYPPSMMNRTIDRAIHRLKETADNWIARSEDNVLGIMLPEGCKVQGYAVPEEALVELPELVMRVEPEEVKRQDEKFEDKLQRQVMREIHGCTCEKMADNLYEVGKPRWQPSLEEPHHPDCPMAVEKVDP